MYWIPLFELLEARGFTVFLVNARHVKNVSGRKVGCARLPVAAAVDELRPALGGIPAEGRDLRPARAYSRQRDMLLYYQARHVQHMQKALTQMNVQLANVISDIVG